MAKIVIVLVLLTLLFRESITDKDLGPNVCQAIWNAAGSNLKVPLELKVDLTGGATPVFTPEAAGKKKIDSSTVFKSFKDVVQSNTKPNQDAFLNEITKLGGPVDKAREYLNDNKLLSPKQDPATFRNTLSDIWFNGGGFVHVFVGEKIVPKQKFAGFHNWYQLYLEQSKSPSTISNLFFIGNDYYTYNTEPSFMTGLKFNWGGSTKGAFSTMFVGTSPAFDFAVFSLCSIARLKGGENYCTCRIHKSTLRIKSDLKAKTGRIISVYPTSVTPDAVCTVQKVPPTSRTDCGWLGIDHHNCAERGCCFDSQQHGGHIYWCFYPLDHKCHGILPQNRKDCGFKGISRNECEGKGCCFDENFGQGVPHCFVGVQKP